MLTWLLADSRIKRRCSSDRRDRTMFAFAVNEEGLRRLFVIAKEERLFFYTEQIQGTKSE
jgi:hypothetical protein